MSVFRPTAHAFQQNRFIAISHELRWQLRLRATTSIELSENFTRSWNWMSWTSLNIRLVLQEIKKESQFFVYTHEELVIIGIVIYRQFLAITSFLFQTVIVSKSLTSRKIMMTGFKLWFNTPSIEFFRENILDFSNYCIGKVGSSLTLPEVLKKIKKCLHKNMKIGIPYHSGTKKLSFSKTVKKALFYFFPRFFEHVSEPRISKTLQGLIRHRKLVLFITFVHIVCSHEGVENGTIKKTETLISFRSLSPIVPKDSETPYFFLCRWKTPLVVQALLF